MKENPTHFMTMAKVGPKGQIVIPKEIRKMFGIKPGDNLMVMADMQRGIAIHRQSVMEEMAKAIFQGQGTAVNPRESEQDMMQFAQAIQETAEKGESKK